MSTLARFALLGLLPLAACGSSEREERPLNLVLVTIDTLRADHLGCYGYPRQTTPTLDALADESLVFERCLAPIPRTTPSHLSLMTTVYPYEHGVVSYAKNRSTEVQEAGSFVPSKILSTFAQSAYRRGYATGGFVSASPVKRITGVAHGFEGWSEPEGHRRPGRATNEDALAWLEQVEGPFFLWLHYMDAHGPYGAEANPPHPPAPYDRLFGADAAVAAVLAERAFPERVSGKYVEDVSTAEMVDLYDGAVRMTDECVAEIVAYLRERGALDETVLVITSDHGQGLGQHGYTGHGEVWREQLRVPLLMRGPGIEPGRTEVLCSLIDVLPTALRFVPTLADPAFLAQGRGTDALAADFEQPPVFGMSIPRRGSTSLTHGRWRYVRRENGPDALYDIDLDPHELTDRLPDEPEVAEQLRAQLASLLAEQSAANERYATGRAASDDLRQNAAHRAELESLGYGGDFDDDE